MSKSVLPPSLAEKVRTCKVLVVGAGGIGCELLKGLVLTGFKDLTVVDLDTIDVSNLNRQFLFRPHHVGRSKASCAAEMVAPFAPGVSIVAHHGNVKEDKFGPPFIAGFDLVINALDNMDARRYVNRMCLATDRPLIEAGTQGYLGQAQIIIKGKTPCIECIPTAPPKTYPICTIRSTPDKPVHCVVWAKELHKLLLGDAKTSHLYDGAGPTAPAAGEGEGGEGGEGGAAGAAGGESTTTPATVNSTYMAAALALPSLEEGVDGGAATLPKRAMAYARTFFQAIFHDDIDARLRVAPETYKAATKRPIPLDLEACLSGAMDAAAAAAASGAGAASSGSGSGSGSGSSSSSSSILPDQVVLSLAASAQLFLTTLTAMMCDPTTRASLGSLEFSKDSELDLDLVTAATNLRAATFSIPLQSRWDVKSIAGSIIPAIATTNAAVAGLQVLEALKLLSSTSSAGSGSGQQDMGVVGRYTYVLRDPTGGPNSHRRALLLATLPSKPATHCPACSTPSLTLYGDPTRLTLGGLMQGVLKDALSFSKPYLDNSKGFMFCEVNMDDDDEEEFEASQARLLGLPLCSVPGGGIHGGCMLAISEFNASLPPQDLSLTLLPPPPGMHLGEKGWKIVGVRAPMPPPLPPPVEEAPVVAPKPSTAGGKRKREGEEGEDGIILVDEEEEGGGEGEGGEESRSKKAKVGDGEDDGILCVE